jgi:hypothetical protein
MSEAQEPHLRISGTSSSIFTIVKPDYLKKEADLFLGLTMQPIQENGLRVLSSVEHDDQTLSEDLPSWIPFRSDVEYVMFTLGTMTPSLVQDSPFLPWSRRCIWKLKEFLWML